MYGGGAEVRHEFYLSQRIACRGRDGKHSESFRAILEAQSSGEHTVSGRVLEDVIGAQTYHPQVSRHLVSPLVEVLLRVEYYGRVSRSTRGGVQPYAFCQGHGGKPKGVGVAQILLCSEGDATYVVHACYVFMCHPRLFQAFLIYRVVHALLHGGFQSLHLQCFYLLPRHRFKFRVEVF